LVYTQYSLHHYFLHFNYLYLQPLSTLKPSPPISHFPPPSTLYLCTYHLRVPWPYPLLSVFLKLIFNLPFLLVFNVFFFVFLFFGDLAIQFLFSIKGGFIGLFFLLAIGVYRVKALDHQSLSRFLNKPYQSDQFKITVLSFLMSCLIIKDL